jgi:miniconductance mechanosensitive channel
MLERFEKIEYLSDYIKNKKKEISHYNRERNIDTSVPVNGRRMTNIGTFRYYVLNYLKNHPGIRNDATLMVRQLPPASEGLPLENICVYINY